MPNAYLTIDDSPIEGTLRLLDFLAARGIQALIFVRGERMAEDHSAIVEAIHRGHMIGNHSYRHRPAGAMSYEKWVEDTENCETEIEKAYNVAGTPRPGKYYRFAYIDRGDGVRVEREFPEILARLSDGEAVQLDERNEKLQQMQSYLKQEGFMQPFGDINHPLYTQAGMAGAADCLMTYSTQDWTMTQRHREKQGASLEGLKQRIDDDFFIQAGHDQIVLVHDEAEIFEVTTALIDHMIENSFTFSEF